jgi:hypothetical protein
MTLSFGDWKLKLIEEIMKLKKEQSLRRIEQEIKSLSAAERELEEQTGKLKDLIKPIKKSISIDDMIKEQNYKPIKSDDFYSKVSNLNIEEPLEELLSMLD